MNPTFSSGASAGDGCLEVLWDDGERLFCSAWYQAEEGPRRCLGVLPAADYPAAGSVDRLAHEYALRDHLDPDWAARPLELARERGRPLLLLEPSSAVPLERFVGESLGTRRLLELAIAVSVALGKMHRRGLVHKDIKPANVLVDPATDQVWLTGFGIATRLLRERPSPDGPELIVGTLAYMAPEQTGRMNRSIDSRSDLYSFGITLHQLLTGTLPFTASDPVEWVHCHIARRPPAPKALFPDAPRQLSALILKLLAKTPDERYQTAEGVERDLRRCLAEWEARGRVDDFPLGASDVADRLLLPEQLYGREVEGAVLADAFEQVMASGTPALVLVSGRPGIGKSAVVNELYRVLVPARGLFASGKFDPLGRDVPCASLAQALGGLVRRLLGKPEAELDRWRRDLRQALEPNAALAVELIPELAFIIGESPAVVEVPAGAAKARFQLTFRRLLGVFARPDQPLVLFLDDLHWLDMATLELIGELLRHPEGQHLLLVGAYRDDEVDAAHPLLQLIAALREGGATVREVTLAALTRDDLARWLADALRCEPEHSLPLARVIHQKTGGNPFFAHQFVHALVDERLLVFDAASARWTWELEPIQAKSHTDNVVDLLAAKLDRLPPATREALEQLACLGNMADAATLAIAQEASEEEVHARLWEALQRELVSRAGQTYRFVHDRVHEAAYSLIPDALRPSTHLRLGRSLLRQLGAGRRDEAIFAIVGQMNRGAALVTAPGERDELAELNRIAARRARLAASHASALHYASTGATLLGAERWQRRRALSLELELQRAEGEFLTGDKASAESRLLALEPHLEGDAERALATCLLADVYVALQRLERSAEVCLAYASRAGLAIPTQPTDAEARAAYDQVWAALDGRPIEALLELPVMTDPVARATVDVLAKIVRCALAQMDENLLCVVLCAAVQISLEQGHCDSSCYVYAYFGFVAGWRFGDFDAGFRFGKLGHELVQQRGLRQFEALVCLTLANRIMPWVQHVNGCRALLKDALELANASGDRVSAVSSACVIVSNLLMAGESLVEVEREAELARAFCRRAAFGDFIHAADTQAAFVRNLRGLTRQFGWLDDDAFDEGRIERHYASQPHAPVFECWYWIRKLEARFFAGRYADALDAAQRARALLPSTRALLEVAEYELYAALSHAALCDVTSGEARAAHVAAAVAHHRQLEAWARHCPRNFEDRALLVAAELARVEGRSSRAMRLYERAIRSAQQSRFVHGEALATELAARFYRARGFDKIARAYLKDARSCYRQWGAHGKVRQLERDALLSTADSRANPTWTAETSVEHLDLATVLEVLQAVSRETDREKLVTTVMRLALSHAGAERGLLILPHADAFWTEAEARIEGAGVAVVLAEAPVTGAALPQSVFQYAVRTRENVLVHDAAAESAFSDDSYFRARRARSVLCLPLLEQTRLVGVIYLENGLTPGAFTPARMAVLQLLATEAAISIENSRLYRELQERETRVRRLVDSNIVGIVIASLDGVILDANDEFLRLIGYSRAELAAGAVRWTELTPPEWRPTDEQRVAQLRSTGVAEPFEKEFLHKSGGRVPVLVGSALFDGRDQGVAFVIDLTDRKRAEEAARESERRYNEIRMQLAYANRVATVGQLSASIAHEVNQPLSGILVNASACLRMLAADPPNIGGASKTAERVIRDANRASDVIRRLRALFTKTESTTAPLDLNEAIREVLALSRGELQSHGITVRSRFAEALPAVEGDRIQLQQLLLNLIKNAIDAMSAAEGPRQLSLSTRDDGAEVVVEVEDTGPGVPAASVEHIFDAFYSTKSGGLGVGLSICRAIVEAHRGEIGVRPTSPRGATFQFTLPAPPARDARGA